MHMAGEYVYICIYICIHINAYRKKFSTYIYVSKMAVAGLWGVGFLDIVKFLLGMILPVRRPSLIVGSLRGDG